MRSLLSMSFDPGSRFVRLMLAEKGLVARLVETQPGADGELAHHNPALSIPVLIDEAPNGAEASIAPVSAIAEYLDEVYRDPPLLPATAAARAEARRIASWFDTKFDGEVNALIARRRAGARIAGRRWDEPEPLRQMNEALRWHLDYLSYLLERRAWLAGERMTIADLAGAAHLSVNDYFSLVPWSEFPEAQAWYARMKSRPSMRAILADRLEGAPPPAHYANLDF